MSDKEEGTDTVTALDYIEHQERLEKDAQSILPGKFEKCTFPLGYVRQALYACKTCSTENEGTEPAGMCYSCSIACHSSHELFELFPKRAFRCDCGLQNKFGTHPCSLMIPAKKVVKTNDKNRYNHNFEGRYCRCDVHYDPEKEVSTMYQCVACEDWFHENCIGNIPEAIEDFECYVCRDCTKKYPFLMNGKDDKFSYGLSIGNNSISKWIIPEGLLRESSTVQPENSGDKPPLAEVTSSESPIANTSIAGRVTESTDEASKIAEKAANGQEQEQVINTSAESGEKRKREEEQTDSFIANTFKKAKAANNTCENVDVSLLPEHDNVEIFLQEGWREGLCKCATCKEGYKASNVEFLLTEEKTHEPEEDEDAGKSLMEVGMEQLQRVDRVQALESLLAYKTLADDIKNYFESFKNTGKIVTKEDINAFFDAKRQERQGRE